MMETRVINIRNNPNWQKVGTVYCGRGSPFGNQFIEGKHGDRREVIEMYEAWFYEQLKDEEFKKAVLALQGKILACFCKPEPCHCDVIVEFLEGLV